MSQSKWMVVPYTTTFIWYNDDVSAYTDYFFDGAQLFDDKAAAEYATLEANKNAIRNGIERNYTSEENGYEISSKILRLSDQYKDWRTKNPDEHPDSWERYNNDSFSYSQCSPEELTTVLKEYEDNCMLPYSCVQVGK